MVRNVKQHVVDKNFKNLLTNGTDVSIIRDRKEPSMANKKNQNNATQTTATNNTVSKEEKNMKNVTVELIEAAKAEGKKVQMGRKGTKNEGFVKIDGEQYQVVEKMPEKEKQVHEAKDRDIKIESGKVGDINVKMIYHREKDGNKQYRIFLAQKIDGKLKRTRYMTEELKANQKDEKFVKKVYDQIITGKVKVQVA